MICKNEWKSTQDCTITTLIFLKTLGLSYFSYWIHCIKETAREEKTGAVLALIKGVKSHPAFGWWLSTSRCHRVITGPFGPAKSHIWARTFPGEQISYAKWSPEGLYFVNIFCLVFMILKFCVILQRYFSLFILWRVNKYIYNLLWPYLSL